MQYPKWYPDWRHEAFHELQAKNELLRDEFRFEDWPRYDYDMATGTLNFSDQGVVRVTAEIQIVGTTSRKAGNWLWAWANSHWPEELTADSLTVRAFGHEHGISDLTHDYVADDDLNGLGWELTAVMVRLTNAVGAYRPPDNDGGLYLTYKNIAWSS
jgi:hypothetical protein